MEAFARRVGWCLLAYAAVAWVPWVTTEYHTHVFTISLYYVVLAVGWRTSLLFGTPRATPYYYLFLGLALAAALAAWEIVHSRIGVFMRAIRDDEEAAAAMGVDTFKWKRVAFVVSAVFAAVAGGFQ